MHYFNDHMSYAQLILALSYTIEQGRSLTRTQINCVNSSVSEPLMKAVLERYPLPSVFKKLLEHSVERERACWPDLDLDVHSAAYGGERDKTAFFLKKEFPEQPDIDVIARTKKLVQRFIATNNEAFNTQLLQAEKARLMEREREFEAGRLRSVRPEASLEEMKADFVAYTEHLERSKQKGSTYAWGTLSSLFRRIDKFPEGSPKRADAELLLLSALDNARTAYHALGGQYVRGKDYTCQKGLDERLLDSHFFLTPVEPPSVSPLSNFLDRLLTPFITYDHEMKGEGVPPACSELLYALYFKAAGYTKVQEAVQRYHLQNKEQDSIDFLRQQYLSSLSHSAEQAHITDEQQLRQEQNVMRFNAAVGMLGSASCDDLDELYGEIIGFLKNHKALEVHEVLDDVVIPPPQPKERKAIVRAMLESGKFLDSLHLYMLLFITADTHFNKMEQLARYNKIPAPYENTSTPSREELQRLHETYLGSEIGAVCHFYQESIIGQRLTNSQRLYSLSICEPAICVWLNDHPRALSQKQKERLAVLCAKSGYSTALTMLVSPHAQQRVSPNYIDSQERYPLLFTAAINSHASTVHALLAAGAHNVNWMDMFGYTALMGAAKDGDAEIVSALIAAGAALDVAVAVTLDDHVQFQATALMLAAKNGDTEIVSALIAAGANIDWQGGIGQDTALILACQQGHLGTVNALIKAGANLELVGGDRNTALICAACNNHPLIVEALLDAGAKMDSQNAYGQSALSHGNAQIIKILENARNKSEKEQKTSVREARIQAEQRFIAGARNQMLLEIEWEQLNLNRFISCEHNALEIALLHHNIALANIVLSHPSLAQRVALNALKKDFDTMLPLIMKHPRFNAIINLHKATFTPQQQQQIDHYQRNAHDAINKNHRKRTFYPDAHEKENAGPQTKRPSIRSDKK